MKLPATNFIAKMMVGLVPLISVGIILTNTEQTTSSVVIIIAAYGTLTLALELLLQHRPANQLQVFACACFTAIATAHLTLAPSVDTGAVAILMRRLFETGLLTLILGVLGLGAHHPAHHSDSHRGNEA